jgi:uncharacterized protein YcbK (DUF882 family)
MHVPLVRSRTAGRALALLGLSISALASPARATPVARALPIASDDSTAASSSSLLGRLSLDSLFGRSGKLRARLISRSRNAFAIPLLQRFFGDSAVGRPGVYALQDSAVGRPLSLITLLPFEDKFGGRVGGYRIGFWPAERGRLRNTAYVNPDGFIEVTPENQDTQLSEHFRLRDFITHDQRDVWPKYVVLREELLDKLELVIADLEAHGIHAEHMAVLSGFRTPQYNALGVGKRGGRARDSRHMFGDAADVFVDNNYDGRMDDLNHDGRVDSRDIALLVQAVERVERAHPELIGGAGSYRGTRSHGPFAHIDVRGSRARWKRA